MANTFQIKRGTDVPPKGTLADGELGYSRNSGLYIGDSGGESLPAFFLEKLALNLTADNNKYYIYSGNIAPNEDAIINEKTDEITDKSKSKCWLKIKSKSLLIITIGFNKKTTTTESGWAGSTYYNNFIIPLKDTGLTHYCSFSVPSENLQGEIQIRTKFKDSEKYIGCYGININQFKLAKDVNGNVDDTNYTGSVCRFELKAYAI